MFLISRSGGLKSVTRFGKCRQIYRADLRPEYIIIINI
jgi:hypothetical protein